MYQERIYPVFTSCCREHDGEAEDDEQVVMENSVCPLIYCGAFLS